MKIVYMGTPDFAVPPLEKLIESHHQVALVVTQPDRIKGRGKKLLPPPVKVLAEEKGIPVIQPEKIKDNADFEGTLREISPDAIVVAAYGKILPKNILDLPKFGAINIHGSLLPRWRGASPIQHAILTGDALSGVTIMQMGEGLDTGDMLKKGEIPIDGMYASELFDKVSLLGGELIVDTLDEVEKGLITPEVQDEELATYAGMIGKDDGRIDFSNNTAAEIERMIRAYEPWPGAYSTFKGEIIKFKKGRIETSPSNDSNLGKIIAIDKEGIHIQTKDGVFVLEELQIPGKSKMDSASYLRGHKMEVGEEFK